MVYFYPIVGATKLTLIRKEAFDNLRTAGTANGYLIFEDRMFLLLQRDTAESCHHWVPAFSLVGGYNAPPGAIRSLHFIFMLPPYLADTHFVFVGERFQERCFHHQAESVQPRDVLGQQVVVGDTGILPLVSLNNVKIVLSG